MLAHDDMAHIPRYRIVVLSDGNFAIRQDDESLQDLLTGVKRSLTPDDTYHAVSEFELTQLKLADVIETYDEARVWLQSATETDQIRTDLPVLKLEQGQLIYPELLVDSQRESDALHGKLAIIACRDEQERRAIMGVLNALKLAVTSVSSAQETLSLIEEEAVDLLVMDVRLQDMHGWAMIGRMREIAHTTDIRVIVLAEGETDEQVFALNVAKVDSYLPKPLSLPLLRQHVWALLKGNANDSSAQS